MHLLQLCCLAVWLSAAAVGQSFSQVPSVRLPPNLDRILRKYEDAWLAHDACRLADLFDAEGFVLAPGYPPIRGRDAIQRFYSTMGGPLALRALSFGVNGDIAYIVGACGRLRGEDRGKFTLTLRRDGEGRWRIMSDMDSSNTAPQNCRPE